MNEHLCNTSTDDRAEVTIPKDEYERLQAEGVYLREILNNNNSLKALNTEMLAALILCKSALHPGAIGLLLKHHGREGGNKASAAVMRARAAIEKSTNYRPIADAIIAAHEDSQEWPLIQDR